MVLSPAVASDFNFESPLISMSRPTPQMQIQPHTVKILACECLIEAKSFLKFIRTTKRKIVHSFFSNNVALKACVDQKGDRIGKP